MGDKNLITVDNTFRYSIHASKKVQGHAQAVYN